MKLFSLALLVVGFSTQVFAQSTFVLSGTAQEKGLAVALETERLSLGFKNYVVDAKMQLMQKGKVLSRRGFKNKVYEIAGDGNYSINVFNSPRDVAGTSVLIYSHGVKADDQWLYLPAVKQVKRISTRSTSGPFAGSEFTYEDISSWTPTKYSYRFLETVTVDNKKLYKIENTPVYSDSGYSKIHEWVDSEIFRPRKIDYFDRKGDLLKTLNFSGYKKYEGYWRPTKMTMVNHQIDRSTIIEWSDYRYDESLNKKSFSKAKLRSTK